MKFVTYILTAVLINSCAVVDSSDFKYLDDEDLEMQTLLIIGAERDVEISFPKSRSATIPVTLFMKPEGLKLPYTKILGFPYEWQWGGPVHKDEGLYLFDLAFSFSKESQLLTESMENRITFRRKVYEEIEEGGWREYVMKNLVVEQYKSKQGYVWVMDNHPTVMPHHEYFKLPVSNERELVVSFWYNEDWVKDHPEWYERRKALSRRILDTVKLSGPK